MNIEYYSSENGLNPALPDRYNVIEGTDEVTIGITGYYDFLNYYSIKKIDFERTLAHMLMANIHHYNED